MKPLAESQTTDAAAAALAIPLLRPGFPNAALRMMSDDRLARLVAGGDRAAFGVVFSRYHQELYRYCLSLLHDREDAADALQGTMLRALRALEGETRAIALRPWLYRIAHNESIDLLRHRPPRAEGAAELQAALDWGVEAGAEARARLRQLLTDLRELPERQRGALVMRELAGLDYAQIAAALETSPAAAKQSVYEARRTLFELAKGRDLDCEGVRLRLSDGDRRSMRARAVRAHLRSCSNCRDFNELTAARRSALSSLIPGLPAGAAAELLRGFGSAGAGSLLTGVVSTAGVKSLAALALVVAAGAGATGAIPHASGSAATVGPAPSRPLAHPHATAPAHPAPAPARAHRRTPAPARTSAGHAHAKPQHSRPAPATASPTRQDTAAPAADPTPQAEQGQRTVAHESQPAPQQAAPAPQPSPQSNSSGSGSGPLTATTQAVAPAVQQVTNTVDTTVTHVQEALPVRTPALPHLRKRFRRR